MKKCEEKITELEDRNSEINLLMSDPKIATDLSKLRGLSDEQENIQTELVSLYEEWTLLSE